MTQPLSPLVCSDRRPGAGPGRQVGSTLNLARQSAGLVVIGLVTTLVVGPPIVAVLSMVFASPVNGPAVASIVPSFVVPIFEVGRVLVVVVLATRVIRTKETV